MENNPEKNYTLDIFINPDKKYFKNSDIKKTNAKLCTVCELPLDFPEEESWKTMHTACWARTELPKREQKEVIDNRPKNEDGVPLCARCGEPLGPELHPKEMYWKTMHKHCYAITKNKEKGNGNES